MRKRKPKPPQLTHADLVARAERWLRGTRRCPVVLTERMAYVLRESVDAVGWVFHEHGGTGTINPEHSSIVVECKTSREDFVRHARKPHSMDGGGAGRFRYFMCPPHVIEPDDLVGRDWGLLWAFDSQIRVQRAARSRPFTVTSLRDELALLYTAFRDVCEKGVDDGKHAQATQG